MENDKKMIAELCGRYHVLMIEDDYLADLGVDKRCLPLHYYDTNQLTVYIRSFSKTFLPGIRLGTMVFSDALRDTVIQQKYLSDICTSGIAQGALNFFLTSGMYDRHVRKVNACYRRKLVKAKAILSHADLTGFSFHVPRQGLFLWITLPIEISAKRIAQKLAQKNIIVSRYGILDKEAQGLRLCIAGVPEKELDSLETMLKIIREEKAEPKNESST
ncbi:PLP-dependent aminotransferase family protein [Sporolactobacillus shoreicorticis]|uniref:Aminotransferase class I/II-fold pyridoxal phosphate-dependent enzyme n=1 Tax=Sporolactobacillus shoreicorticis TaxID=1923877 RepID=A0ABW5S2E4_9BACL|nr:PLP-dependent aminotransferase family protein [Sporolactobacillus shoreicorticis]MCO7126455.1 PLP-dependent aminotransferase family protein [Sporolactobacillus shoreicorticis]